MDLDFEPADTSQLLGRVMAASVTWIRHCALGTSYPGLLEVEVIRPVSYKSGPDRLTTHI